MIELKKVFICFIVISFISAFVFMLVGNSNISGNADNLEKNKEMREEQSLQKKEKKKKKKRK